MNTAVIDLAEKTMIATDTLPQWAVVRDATAQTDCSNTTARERVATWHY